MHHRFIMVFFVVGYMLHALAQVDAIARSQNNAATSRIAIIGENWIRLACRFFISLLAFLFVWYHPELITYLGVSPSSTISTILALPMSAPVAGAFGFAVDSLLAFIPGLKNFVPPPIDFQRVTKVTDETTHTVTQSTVPVAPSGEAK